MKKTLSIVFGSLLVILLLLGVVIHGCGKQGGGSSTGGYTILGTVPNAQTLAMGIGAKATAVTHIVAIGANDSKTIATLDTTTGSFTVPVTSGYPYVLGFFNKSGGAITLLGYLKKADVAWESLPLMNPVGSSTNLGTVTVEASSVEATPSIDVTTLIGQMNMNLATANLYGAIDDPLTALTNLDMDGNGEFDFQENKDYLFQIYVGMNTSGAYVTGEIDAMLSDYNSSYIPNPGYYQYVLAARGDSKTAGTAGTISFPEAITSAGGTTYTSGTGAVGNVDSNAWSLFFSLGSNPATWPATAPNGTYTMEVGTSIYTVKNFKATNVLALGSNNNIIYPVFHLVTNEAGYITTAQYKWKKLNNGTIENATAAEVQAIIEDTANVTTGFSHTSPFISFFSDANTLYGSIIKFSRDGTSVDVSSIGNVKPADVHHIQFSYNLSSRVVCKFDMR
ncbi:hypothetical protein A2276_01830 [candidate division WOR-1 bacterium RIFOXYA12_FULL_43_27]|uniref:Uncharacterized protein n=1 Tax=candidate division WOR-1 bacterium RIFOXYC2_FULL_46_14 TaxID=1802587 RepID=A0A1F4U6Q4_UNCSA|nr:MAG: hypothetical protein A2276_01830 [candidate division WOR-1 bacterium RIFOXYA12_FULL_43_27]OGC19536.1 MAG: hypothetical protein A2292_02500 [candidate division WOR-1 bacterium RIFOXYB2_FULL_46_45]OGC30524.1 MAG: hypothetical protein A2232_02500 [candidate division WOR-1 bacterium RIFOXYA2_FULL_46_56]OGC40592.1 MAG: hypothetical protein A2438_06215 [candidate division WOR-1 bacterium RIFOXYC2_FULL_46_14]